MPLYYDTGIPTPSTKNSITRTATSFGIRDFLLNKNIQNPIRYPQLSTSVNGSPRGGEPFLDTMVGSGAVIQQIDIEVDGIFRYNNAVLMNRYKNTDPTAPSLFDIENIPAVPIFPTAPNGTSDYQQQDINQYGLLAKTNYKEYRKLNTIKNLYLDTPKQIDMADFISVQPTLTSQQLSSYLDEYGNLNVVGSTQVADIIGSVLNGQGIGIGGGGLISNFDLRASLAGRVLTATGLMNDTKLGIIGGQQLALALANNAAFNTQQEILGSLNIQENILSLVKDGNLAGFRPNYQITVPSTTGGQILNTAERILGFNVPRSELQPAGSIFQAENGAIGNIERANNMILNTGKGQVKALLANFTATLNGTSPDGYDSPDSPFSFFRSAYAPGYKNNKGEKMIDPKGYVFMDAEGSILNFFDTGKKDPIPKISYNRSKMIGSYGFTTPSDLFLGVEDIESNVNNVGFSWRSLSSSTDENLPINALVDSSNTQYKGPKKTLLAKTQQLFNSVGMKSILSTKGDLTIKNGEFLTRPVAGVGLSKGSGVLSKTMYEGTSVVPSKAKNAEEVFCRAWTPYNRYSSVKNLIRSRGLNKSEQDNTDIFKLGDKKSGGWRLNLEGSVLDDNGFVKIAPYKGENLTRSASTPKKYMFSIENLAWAGTPAANLLPCEQGPGDLLTGKFGKIMWFPPYNLQFSESSSLNIESTNFIGRGEPIYTYNNTERTGNLSFSVIVDHPSIVNSFAGSDGPSEAFIRSWFAGCVDLDSEWANKLTEEQRTTPNIKKIIRPTTKTIQPIQPPAEFKVYFKNDRSDIDTEYESGISFHVDVVTLQQIPGVGDYQADTKYTKGNKKMVWPDNTDWGLNATPIKIEDETYMGWIDPNYLSALKTFMTEKCPTCKARIDGHASAQGYVKTNKTLSLDRANAVLELLKNAGIPANRIFVDKTASGEKNSGGYSTGVSSPATPVDQKAPKSDRYARVYFENDQKAIEVPSEPKIENVEEAVSLNQQVKNRFYTECDFFEKLERDDPFVFDTFKRRIRYFHPAFHSTTPEGFNSRLTFLLQCTRQGATIANATPKNLAFGPAPVCILRIGDFYNTKIIMDNVNIDYEPLVWDLNPEGVGVQPMIANVTISFKYIGGSSLYGPINKLQNALSFNYFANTQTFDPRADTIVAQKDNKGNVQKTNTRWEDPKITMEDVYTLEPGLDPAKTSLGALTNNEVDKKSAEKSSEPSNDQVKANDNATNTPQTSNVSSTNMVFDLTSISTHVKIPLETSNTLLTLKIKQSGTVISKYNFKLSIFDLNNQEFNIGVGELQANTDEQTYTFKFNCSSPTFKFSVKEPTSANKYQVKLDIIKYKTVYLKTTL